jgi:hypothetical protein
MKRPMCAWAAAAMVLGGAAGAGSAAALPGVPLPPAGATKYQFAQVTCKLVTTSGGLQQVRVRGHLRSWVIAAPPAPKGEEPRHRIYQTAKVELKTRALGGWKTKAGETWEGPKTEARIRNRLVSRAQTTVGLETATGATFRLRATVRVLSYRPKRLDVIHWKYVAWSAPFVCPDDGDGRATFVPEPTPGSGGGGGLLPGPGPALPSPGAGGG